MIVFTVHKAANVGKTFLEGAHVQPDRAGTVCLAQFLALLADKHERHPTAAIMFQMVERTADAVQERREVEIIRDDSFRSCGKVFFIHDAPPFGRYLLADRLNFSEDTGRPFFVRFQKLVKRIIGSFYVYLRYDIRFIDANGILFFFHAKRRCRTYV